MLRAAIDIGSNSIRLLVADVQEELGEKKIIAVAQALATTRLALSDREFYLSSEAIGKTVAAIKNFCVQAKNLGVKQTPVLFATSAVREAKNAFLLQQAVQTAVNLPIRVLSGEEEAWYTFCGATSFLPAAQKKQAMVIDIGGGSTEWVRPAENGVLLASLPLGSVKAYARKMDRPEITSFFAPWRTEEKTAGKLLAAGGTATAAAAMILRLTSYSRKAVNGFCVSQTVLTALRDELAPLSVEERRKRYPLLGARADIMVSGLDILLVLLTIFNKEEFLVSDYGILDGYLLEE